MDELTPLSRALPKASGSPILSPPKSLPSAAKGKQAAELSRAELSALATAREDAACRFLYPSLVCPSWRYAGQEAGCPDCRDIGWTTALVDPTNERSGTTAVFCHCQKAIRADRRVSYIAGERMAREIRFETFRLSWQDIWHNRLAANALEAAKAWSRAWADMAVPPWLALIGPPGCGKTHLAISAIRYLTECGVSNSYYQSAELIAIYKLAMDDDARKVEAAAVREKVMTIQALVLDDIGMERGTAYNESELEAVLTIRAQKRLMTCITSNSMKNISERVQSRLFDATLCAMPDLTGSKDVRKWL